MANAGMEVHLHSFLTLAEDEGEWPAVNQSHYRPEVPGGFQEVKVPRLRDNGPEWW
jgi:hypothetical protein